MKLDVFPWMMVMLDEVDNHTLRQYTCVCLLVEKQEVHVEHHTDLVSFESASQLSELLYWLTEHRDFKEVEQTSLRVSRELLEHFHLCVYRVCYTILLYTLFAVELNRQTSRFTRDARRLYNLLFAQGGACARLGRNGVRGGRAIYFLATGYITVYMANKSVHIAYIHTSTCSCSCFQYVHHKVIRVERWDFN